MNQVAQAVKPWAEVVQEAMPKFNEIASAHKLVRWQEESLFAMQALQKNDQLSACAPHTVRDAIINVASVGLTLNPADGFAYLVPEYNKQTKQNECQLRISFRGLLKVANDSGAIMWAKAEIVKESDDFQYKGPCTAPEHSMNPFADRGNPVGVYCIAKTSEGDMLVDVMSWPEVMKIKTKAKTDMVWNVWPEEMAKKAIIKRAFKQWPKKGDGRLAQAVHVLNEHEGSPDFIEGEIDRAADLDETLLKYVQALEARDGYLLHYLDRNMHESLSYSIWRRLNSKQKSLARELQQQAVVGLDEFKRVVEEHLQGDDDLGIRQCWDELGKTGVSMLWPQLNPEQQEKVRELLKKTEAD